MRVAMLIQGFHPRIGGAERQLQALAPCLRRLAVDVHVVTRRYGGLDPHGEVAGAAVHRIAIPGPKPVASAAFTAGAVARLRALRPDVIHAHELLSPATAGLLAGALLSTPVVAKVLISGEVAYLRDERPFGRQRWAALRRRVRCFVAISRDIDRELEAAGVPPQRRRFIPNGVDTDRFAPATRDRRAQLRSELGIDQGPVVVYVGRLEPQKNLEPLVAMWGRVRAAHPDAQLLLAGQGSRSEGLADLAGAGVRLLGPIDDVAPLLRSADAFVLPSLREGLSNALLEAMSCGLPVVATAVGGATEVVLPDETGLLVEPGDAAALEKAVLRLLDDRDLGDRLGSAGRGLVVERHALDERARELHTLYQELSR